MKAISTTAARIGLFTGLMLAGACSGKNTPASQGPAKTSQASTALTRTNQVAAKPRRSIFLVDAKVRDPFFPQLKTAGADAPPVGTADIASLLQAGFGGILEAGGERVAIVNGIILENGRNTSVPVRSGDLRRNVTVKVKEVTSNSVILDVQGLSQPVTLRSKLR